MYLSSGKSAPPALDAFEFHPSVRASGAILIVWKSSVFDGAKIFVGYHKTGYPERISKEPFQPHKKQSQKVSRWLTTGPVRAHRLSASPSASHGRSRRPDESPPRTRPRTGSLDREPLLRLARGPARTASNEAAILRIARGRLGNNPSLPPRPVFPTACYVLLMRQPLLQSLPDDGSTPWSGRRDKESHQHHTG